MRPAHVAGQVRRAPGAKQLTAPHRNPAEESARLHRAKRAAELRERDAVLCAADRELQNAKAELAKVLLAVMRGRPEALDLVGNAVTAVQRARQVLRDYFDNYRNQHDSSE